MRHRIKNRFLIYISGVIIITGAIGMTATAMRFISRAPIQHYYSDTAKIRSVWDWTSLNKKTEASIIKSEAHQLKLKQINTVFVDISKAADLTNNKSSDNVSFANSLSDYVKIMNSEGIQVKAAAGDKDWSKPELQHVPVSIQNFVCDYNKSHTSAAVKGLEFDIESYNQTGFPEAAMPDKDVILTEFLDMVSKLASNQKALISKNQLSKSFTLGFSIPYWYDNENNNISSVTWNNKTGPVLYHLLDQLNTLNSSNVVVMSYRNAAGGNDGSIAHARTEVAYAQAKAPRVKVIIGQETTDVQPSKITFYGHSIAIFSQEVNAISNEFSSSGVYGGIAINDLNGYLALQSSQF